MIGHRSPGRFRTAVVASVAVAAAVMTTATGGTAVGAASGRAAEPSPLLALPAGAVPAGVPYAIGKKIYLNGLGYDLAPYWATLTQGYQPWPGSASEQFADVAISRGVIVWSISMACIDPCSAWGNFVPGGAPRPLPNVHGAWGPLATTTGGLVALSLSSVYSEPVEIFTTAGASYPPPFSGDFAYPPFDVTVQGVAGSFVFQGHDSLRTEQDISYRMYPGYPPVRLPADNTYGVGQGSGWLATAGSYRGSCYRTAAYATPNRLRARICSQTRVLVSDDGSRAVAVRANHVRLFDTATGAQINATDAPTLAPGGYQPIQWETATTYLVYAADGVWRIILRCAVTGACERAVTSSVRAGVTGIVH